MVHALESLMENLKLNGRNRGRGSRSTWQGSTALFTAAVLLACATTAFASGKRARLSSDLVAHLNSNSSASVDIIVSGSQERIDRLVKRHGLVVKKVLTSGAVLTASRKALDSVSQDWEVDALGGDPVVHSASRVTASLTADVIGADAAWAGD
ncbi:MAG: hypothetical protein EXQ54_03420, partial [Acidobacteria bacterium]|nr:hypothetical protein [Acidobacteriota bacterium]